MTDANLVNQELRAVAGEKGTGLKTSFLPIDIAPGTPPTMRQHTRWDYVKEYVDFYLLGVKSKVRTIVFFALGLLMINYFAPGAFLMFALAARAQDQAWWCNYINNTFGKYRSIVLID